MGLISLKEGKVKSIEEIGGKCFYLSKIYTDREYNVPRAICIETDIYMTFLSEKPYWSEIKRLLEGIKTNPISARKNLGSIREYIEKDSLDNELFSKIKMKIKEEGVELLDGVSVRSSGLVEDGRENNFAGVYNTTLDIKTDESLEKAILKTYASVFSEEVYFYMGTSGLDKPMAIIIEQMKYGDFYGVLFTKDINDIEERAYCECSYNIGEVVDGRKKDIGFYLSLEEDLEKNQESLSIIAINKLRILSKKLVKENKSHLDIEFVIDGDNVSILQYRPLIDTKSTPENLSIVDEDDINSCTNLNLSFCNYYFSKYLGKQYLFRKISKEEGFQVYKNYYLFVKNAEINSLSKDFFKTYIKSDFVLVEFGKDIKKEVCRVEDIKKIINKRFLDIDKDKIVCRIGEIIFPDFSAYSSIIEGNKVYVEYVPYAMKGLIIGTMEPIRLLIDNDGSVEYLQMPIYKKVYDFDKNTGEIIKKPYNKKGDKLSLSEVKKIYEYTVKMSKRFNEARLELYYSNNTLYSKDISLEDNTLEFTSVNLISSGVSKGEVFHLEFLEDLDKLAEDFSISLVKHEEKEDKVLEEEYVKSIIKSFQEKDIILFVERPSKGLLLFCAYVKGFVFEKGSVLSHIGILLREKGIVGVIDQDSYYKYQNGDRIEVVGDKIISLDK